LVVTRAVWRDDYNSWGNTLSARHLVLRPECTAAASMAVRTSEAADDGSPVLAYGCGRSYGDVALNPGGRLIDCRGLDRFIEFDPATGVLSCEAGVRLADILAVVCRPEPGGGGWFPPVSPGTRFVTVGGAIANDVHGKNHHRYGTFGRHVLSFELARSDGRVVVCSARENTAFFAATIGGLGLTGLILRATIQLRRVPGLAMETEEIRFEGLDDFFALARESDHDWEYTAAWIDCLAREARLGRGLYSRARHVPGVPASPPDPSPRLHIPATPPVALVTSTAVRGFNAAYWRKLGRSGRRQRVGSCEPVLYPLDAVGAWNRLYGRHGFFQFQCVVPPDVARAAIAELLRRIAASDAGSMLTVLKCFGDLPSPGLLSFPMPGVTLALDFPNRGEDTRRLLAMLEHIVIEAGGRLYPAKDCVMTAASFRAGYPRLSEFLPAVDHGFSSAFAQRTGILGNGQSAA
jgi:FAD/FMN-containing dehydrogenase